MSKLVAFAAIQGGYNIVSQVEGEYKRALDTFDADTKVGFPNTAYFLPVIYSLLGIKVETLEDIRKLDIVRKALRNGRIEEASQKSKVYTLTPVAV